MFYRISALLQGSYLDIFTVQLLVMHVNGLQILEYLNIMHTIRLKKSFGKNDVILNDTNNEPRHSISYKIACAPSEDSDQTARSDQSSLST